MGGLSSIFGGLLTFGPLNEIGRVGKILDLLEFRFTELKLLALSITYNTTSEAHLPAFKHNCCPQDG
jgi:hypothetical protein